MIRKCWVEGLSVESYSTIKKGKLKIDEILLRSPKHESEPTPSTRNPRFRWIRYGLIRS